MIILIKPRISIFGASDVCQRLGKTHRIRSEDNGFSGGVWLLWNEETIKVELLNVNKSFIHIAIKSVGIRRWLFIVVYASPKAHTRKLLWLALDEPQFGDPWMIIKYFNCDLNREEWSSGS